MCGAGSALLVTAAAMGAAHAEPADDALAKLDELSAQAVRSREAVTTAQRDADAAHARQAVAEDRQRADLTALEAADTQLAPHQMAVDRLAAMTYMGGGHSQMTAALTASSPQRLIDGLSLQHTMEATATDQLRAYRETRERAAAAALASERSAADARVAAERAAAVRADLQTALQDLLRRIAAAEAQYALLTPQQQAVIESVDPAVAAGIEGILAATDTAAGNAACAGSRDRRDAKPARGRPGSAAPDCDHRRSRRTAHGCRE